MNSSTKLPNNLQLFRVKLNLTQNQMAEYMGVSREEVSYYENGQRIMPLHLIQKAAELFGVDEYDLEEGDASELELNLSFAFRADQLSKMDLESIAKFKTIARNYLKMVKND